MVCFLIHYIIVNSAYLAMPIRKRTIPFLPLKFSFDKAFLVDSF